MLLPPSSAGGDQRSVTELAVMSLMPKFSGLCGLSVTEVSKKALDGVWRRNSEAVQ